MERGTCAWHAPTRDDGPWGADANSVTVVPSKSSVTGRRLSSGDRLLMLPDNIGRSCATCGERASDTVCVCAFCGDELGVHTPNVPFRRSVRAAATAWSRTIAGAPLRFAELIRAVVVRDEIVQRVATEIVRRELRLHVEPAIRGACTGQNLDPSTIDPFLISADQLRARSEHLRRCNTCAGSGACPCDACAGAGTVHCKRCAGTGQTAKWSAQGRLRIACEACFGHGVVACDNCQGAMTRPCVKCSGDGHQRVWFSYQETSRWIVDTMPARPAVEAYAQLAAPRFLTTADLDGFAILRRHEVAGSNMIAAEDDAAQVAAARALNAADRPIERPKRQQYLRLLMVRRDIRYRMCAASGSVVFCGHDLVAVATPAALRPMHVRNALWLLAGSAFALLGRYCVVGIQGQSAYFGAMNTRLDGLWLLGTLAALPVIGGMLRALRNGMGERRLHKPEIALGFCAVMACIAVFGVRSAAQPNTAEVQAALDAGQVAEARVVVGALKETLGNHVAVRRAEDDVLLAEAAELPFKERLRMLDAVVARAGPQAPDAAASARSYRLQEIQRLMNAGLPSQAVRAIDEWFPVVWKDDPGIAEARAAAHDLELSMCADELCRFRAARNANLARACPDRSQTLALEREHLISALATNHSGAENPSDKLERLQRLLSLAADTEAQLGDDSELCELAKRALAYAYAERAKLGVAPDEPIRQALSVAPRMITAEGARHP